MAKKKSNEKILRISETEYSQMCDEYMGYCFVCGEWKDSVEPDAEGYSCDNCGSDEVMGAEQIAIHGLLEFK
jgi:hypothetical protein